MNRVKQLRKQRGLSQLQLAERLQVSQQSISRYEKDESNIPNDILLRMAKLFNTSVEYILRNTSEAEETLRMPNLQNKKDNILDIFQHLTVSNQQLLFYIASQLLELQNGNSSSNSLPHKKELDKTSK